MNKILLKVMLPACLLLIVLLLDIFGHSGSKPGDIATVPSVGNQTEPALMGPQKVVWWHSMSGDNGKVVDRLVTDFNASHKDIQVEAVYQGSYYESLTKLKASMDSKIGPTMIQVYDIGTRYMIDSKSITPVQHFIDQDHYDISQLEENITNYYKLDNLLYTMPFNASNPILFYNKDMFRAAGLDPEKPPITYEQFTQAAKKLTKDGIWGASFAIHGWYMEQLFANQGAELMNNGNGRDSLATAWQLNAEEGLRTLIWWKDLVDSKLAINFGRRMEETKKAFVAGKVSMIFDTTASLRNIIDSVDGKFEVGTGFLPKPANAKDGGVIVGGASNWIMNSKSDAEQKAAWAFIKYLSEPEQQAFFHVNTGYFPITKKEYDQQLVQENMAKYPQFKTAIDQLHAAKENKATQGGVLGIYPEARQITENAIEQALTGQKTPKEALDAAAAEISAKIEDYNRTVK
ncbi:ABC transporter substrate-binding protein [Paenibacillus sp. GCM10027628]|uniref:ABC transporter substrate-binding protein n=1 Tax=Paenibacillus sp. GCM10027628 TaxID=3273413 RepID=UPI00363E4283